MRRFCVALLAGLALYAAPVVAQAPRAPDPLLDRLIGRWVLHGQMAGKVTTHDVTFTWVLEHEYVQMHEVSRERTSAGIPAYEALVLITPDTVPGGYAAQWLDNTAASPFDPRGVGRGIAAGDSIPFVFDYSPTDHFHNTFVYHRDSDTWEWHLDNDVDGVRKMFARVLLTRAP